MSELTDKLRQALRARHYSQRTEQAYCLWTRRFICFHGVRHPAAMGEAEINAFLTHLTVEQHVSASTQIQALSALLFLYRHVLGQPVGKLGDLVRAHASRPLPVVLTRAEVQAVLGYLQGDKRLMASLMYGSGLRLMECLHLRVLDLEFARGEIVVRHGKGDKDRITMLPASLQPALRYHLQAVKAIHERDLADGWGEWDCRMHCRRSIRTHQSSGTGSGSFRNRGDGRTSRRANRVATTCTRRSCSER